jgi:CRP-like cAMP-binding protein
MNSPESAYQRLFDYVELKSSLQLSNDEKRLIMSAFKMKHFRKRQYLLQEGDICKYMAFIVEGAGRMFIVTKNGQETILRFAVESWWLGDYESYNLSVPSAYNIEMTEDSDVLLITLLAMNDLCQKVPPIAQMVKEIDRSGAIASQKRIHTAISLGAEERYEALVQKYPEFVRRFPQSMIASYLGMSPETLSRIRKNLLGR